MCNPAQKQVLAIVDNILGIEWFESYTRKKRTTCNKPAADLQQVCWNKLVARFIRTACSQLVDKLLQACSRLATSSINSTALLHWVVPTTCYRAAINNLSTTEVVSNKLGTTWQINSIATTCWQACYKFVASTTCWRDERFLRVYFEWRPNRSSRLWKSTRSRLGFKPTTFDRWVPFSLTKKL